MEIINPDGIGGNPFGDIQPMGCGTEALAPPNTNGGGGGTCKVLNICDTYCLKTTSN